MINIDNKKRLEKTNILTETDLGTRLHNECTNKSENQGREAGGESEDIDIGFKIEGVTRACSLCTNGESARIMFQA